MLGFSTSADTQMAVSKHLKVANSLALDAIELSGDWENIYGADAKEIKKNFEDYGVIPVVHAPFIDINLGSPNRGIREESIRQVCSAIDLAFLIGSQIVVLHPDRIPFMAASKEELDVIPPTFRENCLEISKSSVLHCIDYAKDYGIQLALENLPMIYGSFGSTPEEIENYLSSSETLFFTFDVGHANTVGAPENFLKIFKKRGRHVHLSDNNGRYDQHLALGDGNIDFVEIIKKILKTGYKGLFIIEAHSIEDVEKSVRWIRERINNF